MPSSTSLPSATNLIHNLFATFARPPGPVTTFSSSSFISQKPTLLTLHALFPTTLLPALDVLDRRLITRLIVCEEKSGHARHSTDEAIKQQQLNDPTSYLEEIASNRSVYYVRSNAPTTASRGRYSSRTDTRSMNYEVRTGAWSCTCAAFAFAAFGSPAGTETRYTGYEEEGDGGEVPMVGISNDVERDVAGGEAENGREGLEGDVEWGGRMLRERGEDVPVCKHLMACVLAERWDVAAAMVEERRVGRGEMAGWAAGWGG